MSSDSDPPQSTAPIPFLLKLENHSDSFITESSARLFQPSGSARTVDSSYPLKSPASSRQTPRNAFQQSISSLSPPVNLGLAQLSQTDANSDSFAHLPLHPLSRLQLGSESNRSLKRPSSSSATMRLVVNHEFQRAQSAHSHRATSSVASVGSMSPETPSTGFSRCHWKLVK